MNYKLAIIGLLLGGLVMIGASVSIGVSLRDSEVVDNAYEAGLRYDQTVKNDARLGWTVELPRTVAVAPENQAGLVVMVKDREGNRIKNAQVKLTLNRMGSPNAQTCQCIEDGDGRYRAPIALDATGYWDARVLVARAGDSRVFDERIFAVK